MKPLQSFHDNYENISLKNRLNNKNRYFYIKFGIFFSAILTYQEPLIDNDWFIE